MSCAATGAVAAQLPLRGRPKPDESLVGYVSRIAYRNYIHNPVRLLHAGHMKVSSIHSVGTVPFDLRQLSVWTGQSVEVLKNMAYWPSNGGREYTFFGNEIGQYFVTTHYRRYCPHCLADSPHHRAAWDLSIATACPEHRVRLLAHCPSCSKKLGWDNQSITTCLCSADLRNAKPRKVAENDLGGLRVLYQRLHGSSLKVSHEALSGMSPGTLMELFYTLGAHADWPGKILMPNVLMLKGVDVHKLINVGWQACQGMPSSMHSYLDRFHRKAGDRDGRYGLRKLFGAIGIRAASSATHPEIREFLLEAMNQYLNTEKPGRTRVKSLRSMTLMSLKEAAAVLGCKAKVTAVFHKHEAIRFADGRGQGAPILIDAEAVARAKADLDDLADKRTLKRMLNCSERGLETVLSSGWFTPARGIGVELLNRTCWRKSDALAALSEMEKRIPGGGNHRNTVPMSIAISSSLYADNDWSRKGVDELLKSAVLDERASGLARIRFARSSLRNTNRDGVPGMTIPSAALHLKIKMEVAYYWVRLGLLEVARVPGKRGKRVSEEAVAKFKAIYFIASQSGLDKSKWPGWTSEQLISEGIEPVTGPHIDGGRQYLFRREDVARSRNPRIRSAAAVRSD